MKQTAGWWQSIPRDYLRLDSYASNTTTRWQFTRSTRPPWRTRSGQAFYERDAETTVDYALFRYDPSRLGRFMTPDPIAGPVTNPQSLNRYAYVVHIPAWYNC